MVFILGLLFGILVVIIYTICKCSFNLSRKAPLQKTIERYHKGNRSYLNTTKNDFEPFVGVGPIKFGMSKSEVDRLQATLAGFADFNYKVGKLSSFTIYPDKVEQIIFAGEDVLKMEKLSAALHFAQKSDNYGQAQGGSLYFMDLGCAILQFESSIREFLFFSQEHSTGELLAPMTPENIESYYIAQTYDN